MISQYPQANNSTTTLIWRKTMSGGETSLSGYDDSSTVLSYTPGQEQVYLNGILLLRGSDYTATDGTSITGISALAASDVVQVNAYNNFNLTTSLPASNIYGTLANNQLANSTITINGSAISLGGSISNLATTSDVSTAISNLVNSAPSTLDTLNELATSLGNDANFATTVTTALGNKQDKRLTINAQVGTSYNLQASDANSVWITCDNGSAITVNVPANTFSIGDTINIQQTNTGQVTFAQSGTTITSTGATASAPKLRARYSSATIICVASNTFTIIGDIS